MPYVKGDWNVICDTCGKERKASQCRLTWDNFLVCADTCWEPRQPQDFVRGKVDRQRVPPHLHRPEDQDGWFTTTTAATYAKGATTIQLASVDGIAQYTTIGIETDVIIQDASGITGDTANVTVYEVHWTTVSSVSSPNIVIADALPYASTSGRTVHVLHDSRFLGTNEVTVESLG